MNLCADYTSSHQMGLVMSWVLSYRNVPVGTLFGRRQAILFRNHERAKIPQFILLMHFHLQEGHCRIQCWSTRFEPFLEIQEAGQWAESKTGGNQVLPGQTKGGGSYCFCALRFTSQSTCRSGPHTASHSASQAGQCTTSH